MPDIDKDSLDNIDERFVLDSDIPEMKVEDCQPPISWNGIIYEAKNVVVNIYVIIEGV